MSTNAAVTVDGGEIARAQATQAFACRVKPAVDMNPVLLKPQSDRTAQLIVHGRVRGILNASDFCTARAPLFDEVLSSYRSLTVQSDIVVCEGAGSPAEINLRQGDISNMGFARAADVPVVLIGDIDRGGVIAAIVGTRAVLDSNDADMIQGFVINKFRGDPSLFDDGYHTIASLSGWPGFGIIPWLPAASRLPSEDTIPCVDHNPPSTGRIIIACPLTPHIANFDDLDPWTLEPNFEVRMIPPGQKIPEEASLIVLPGSKATISDLAAIRAEGWDIDILAHRRRGGYVLGLCAGYQILGQSVADPLGIEGSISTTKGLGLLDVETVIYAQKHLEQVSGTAMDAKFDGYLMHMGDTNGRGCKHPFAHFLDGRMDGAVSPDGRVIGTYIHGLFGVADQRAAWTARFNVSGGGIEHATAMNQALDDLALCLEAHLDVNRLLAIIR